MMSRLDPQFKLRLPLELKERIEEDAKKNKRSINAEIVDRLESSFSKKTRDSLLAQAIAELKEQREKENFLFEKLDEQWRKIEILSSMIKK